MQIELKELGAADLPLLENLAQLYQYDFSEFDGNTIGDDGRFGWVDWPRLFEQPEPHAFLVLVDGRIAGFVGVHADEAMRDPDERVWWMNDFFVMRGFRGRGVGEHVATALFDRFDGAWEVAQIDENVAAQSFWRKIIGRYTQDTYEEFVIADHRWHGPVQYFLTTNSR